MTDEAQREEMMAKSEQRMIDMLEELRQEIAARKRSDVHLSTNNCGVASIDDAADYIGNRACNCPLHYRKLTAKAVDAFKTCVREVKDHYETESQPLANTQLLEYVLKHLLAGPALFLLNELE